MDTIKAKIGTMAEQNAALAPYGLTADGAKALRSAASLAGTELVAVIDGGHGYGYAIVDRAGAGRQAYYGKMTIINQAGVQRWTPAIGTTSERRSRP